MFTKKVSWSQGVDESKDEEESHETPERGPSKAAIVKYGSL
jgi:hypothetical protein